jgi:hypothetical protein
VAIPPLAVQSRLTRIDIRRGPGHSWRAVIPTSVARVAIGLAVIGAIGLCSAGPAMAQPRPPQPSKEKPRFNIPTGNPVISAVNVVGGSPTPLQNVTVHVTVSAPGVSMLRFDPTYDAIVLHQLCFFVLNQAHAVADAPVVNGQAVLQVQGMFFSSLSTTSCTMAVRVHAVDAGGQARDQVLTAPVPVRPWARYTITDTARLTSRLAFHTRGTVGVCEGLSIGIHSHNVGVGAHNGQLTINMRSGPIGTLCYWESTAWRLPDGAKLVEATWAVATEGSKCCLDLTDCPNLPVGVSADHTTVVPGHIIPGSVGGTYEYPSPANPVVSDLGENFGSNPGRHFLRFLRPMWTRLTCGTTLDNDHGIRITLKSVTIDGPPGLTLP